MSLSEGQKDMGKVMKAVMGKVKGRLGGKLVLRKCWIRKIYCNRTTDNSVIR